MRTTLWILALCASELFPAYVQAQDSGAQKNPKTVRVAYLVPSHRRFQSQYRAAIKDAIRNVQAWYQGHTDNTETFQLAHPTVDVVRTNHTATWYSTNPVSGSDFSLWFWFNALADAFSATGGEFFDPNHRWVFYIDADVACGQVIGGAAGVALLAANDLRGLTAQQDVPACPGEPPDTAGVCRWVGGLGHELGHAFGLEHPVPCPSGSDDAGLMCLGYITYPATYLTPSDKDTLNASPFFLPLRPIGLGRANARNFGCTVGSP